MKRKPYRSKKYLRHVASQPCLLTGHEGPEVVAHHLTRAEPGIMGGKVSDEWCVPLHSIKHRQLHDHKGGEKDFWMQEKGWSYVFVMQMARSIYLDYIRKGGK